MNKSHIILLAALLGLAACEPRGAGGGAGASAEPPVARVNGQPISREFFDFYVKGVSGKDAQEITAEQREQLLDNLVRAEVVAQQASRDGLDKQSETASLLQMARLNVLQQAASESFLKDKAPTEQELRAEYETQIAALPRQEYRASHILVATEDFARRLIVQLQKGAKFADLAKRESMDSSKDNGGDLGWFTPDRMVKPFADAVVQLKPGEFTSTPVQTQYGWHVIRLDDTRELAPPQFEEVRQRLEQIVQSKKFRAYSDELLKSAKVEKTGPAAAAAEG